MLHKTKKLLLELILTGLQLSESGSCGLCLASLLLLHPIKYGYQSRVCLRWLGWS